jgi:hypothetical protein
MYMAALAEVQKLESELAQTEAYKKLQLAKQVVELYRPKTESGRVEVAAKPLAPARPLHFAGGETARPNVKIVYRPETKASRVEAIAAQYLRQKGRRATSGELLAAMKSAGMEITGSEPNKALSAYLSNSKALNNVREFGGYGLVEWGNNKGPDLLTETGA